MRKKIALIFILTVCLQAVPADFFAADLDTPKVYANEAEDQVRMGDTIVYKIRMYNGKQQYRRWNETKQCWVDPKWIDMP